MKRNGRSNRRELVLALGVAAWVATGAAQTNPMRMLGSFPWDTSQADVLLQRVSRDRMLVQLRVLTESNTSAGRRQTRPLPTGAMEAWVLLEDGTALEQTPRQPPKGAPPVSVGESGDRYAFVDFGFKWPVDARVAAVVVKLEDQLHIFPSGGPLRAADMNFGDRRPTLNGADSPLISDGALSSNVKPRETARR